MLATAGLGMMAGLLFPSAPRNVASQSYSFKFMMTVPTGSSWGHLSCGYHSACPDPNGVALDWTTYNDAPSGLERAFSFRAWGHSPLYSGATKAGAVWRATNPFLVCKAVDVQIWRDGEPSFRGIVRYLHADSGGPDMWIADLYVSQWGERNWAGVGWMTTQEKPNCPWAGVHVHEMHDIARASGIWRINSTQQLFEEKARCGVERLGGS